MVCDMKNHAQNGERPDAGHIEPFKSLTQPLTRVNDSGITDSSQTSSRLKTASPLSWLPLFNRIWHARNLAQMHAALNALVPRLLGRGQDPQAIAADLVQLAQQAGPGLHLVVVPVVNDLALAHRRAA